MIEGWELVFALLVFAVLTAAIGVAVDFLWRRSGLPDRRRRLRGFDVTPLRKA
jgi:hypothetical protein